MTTLHWLSLMVITMTTLTLRLWPPHTMFVPGDFVVLLLWLTIDHHAKSRTSGRYSSSSSNGVMAFRYDYADKDRYLKFSRTFRILLINTPFLLVAVQNFKTYQIYSLWADRAAVDEGNYHDLERGLMPGSTCCNS